MICFNELEQIRNYISKVHGPAMLKGVNCYTTFRESDGKKTIVSISKGFQTTGGFDIIPPNSLSLHFDGWVSGKTVIGHHILEHSIYLSDLIMINVLESFTEFLTMSRINFMYVLENGPTFALNSSIDMNLFVPFPTILAQWAYKDERLENQLEHLGKTVVIEKEQRPLMLDLD